MRARLRSWAPVAQRGICVLIALLLFHSGTAEASEPQQPHEQATPTSGETTQVVRVPLSPDSAEADVKRSGKGVSVHGTKVPAELLIAEIAAKAGLGVIFRGEISDPITVHLDGVDARQAIRIIADTVGAVVVEDGDNLRIVALTNAGQLRGAAPGMVTRTFRLRFVRARDVRQVLEMLKSPAGSIQVVESQPTTTIEQNTVDILHPGDIIVVRDFPTYMTRIEMAIEQIDVPPPQVLIEARVLEVRLKKGYHTGFQFLSEVEPGNEKLTIAIRGFANPLSQKGFVATLDAAELDAILDLLETTTDAKTLAAPRVLVTHGQQARIQIGRSLSYRVVTVTEVAQVEDVKFLDTGVVLRFVPYIDPRGRILLRIRPEVSQGEINEQTGLPDKSTTEAETTVLLSDGRGVVIGGLIQESATDSRSKVRRLGDLPIIGKLFRRDQVDNERREIIIALIPHIYPGSQPLQDQELLNLDRVTYPLVNDQLNPVDRPWEPKLRQPDPDELFKK